MKKIVLIALVLGLLFYSCDTGNGTNDDGETYFVTIGALTNANGCSITASPTSGKEGTEITLTVNEVTGFRLKAGSLKYGTTIINETTKKFNLPASDVTVTAEFEQIVDQDIQVSFINISEYDSLGWETNRTLVLIFDKYITGLSLENITFISNDTGAVIGTLTETVNVGEYDLTITDIESSGTIEIAVQKNGFIITPTSKIKEIVYSENPAQQIVGTWLCDDFEQDRWFRFESNGTGEFDNNGSFSNSVTFNYSFNLNGSIIFISNSSGWEAIPNGSYSILFSDEGLKFTITSGDQEQVYKKQI